MLKKLLANSSLECQGWHQSRHVIHYWLVEGHP